MRIVSVSIGKKRKRCFQCENCLREDCRSCTNCLDMKKYGGEGVKKQCCMLRRCTGPSTDSQPLDKGLVSVFLQDNHCIIFLAFYADTTRTNFRTN